MKNVYIIDNNQKNAVILNALLQSENNENVHIDHYADFNLQLNPNISENFENLINAINDLDNHGDICIHFLIDLLLTENEEQRAFDFRESFQDGTDEMIATGIKVANYLIQQLNGFTIKVTFLSKWLNLHSEENMREYNGIKNNAVWENIDLTSIVSPISEEHEIVNLSLCKPKYGSRTTIGTLFNVVYNDFGEEVENEHGE